MTQTSVELGNPCLLTVVEAARLLVIGRTLAYRLIRDEA